MSANAEIIAELRRVLNERDEARERNTDLRTMLEQVTRERDSYQRQLDAIGDALVTSIVKRIEPRLSRHPVTVIMAAGSLFAKIGEAIGCEFADGDDLLEAVKELVRERDEARRLLELAHLGRAQLEGWRDGLERERDEARAERDSAKLTATAATMAHDAIEKMVRFELRVGPEDSLHTAVQRVRHERDEARAEVERWRQSVQILAKHEWVTDGRECLSFCLHCGRKYNAGHADDCEVFGQNGFLMPEARHV